MYGVFFGRFCQEKSIISKDELERILSEQRQRNVPLGVLAMEYGFLDASAVENILGEQQDSDRLFGDLALEMDVLSKDQLELLVRSQVEQHHYFGMALVENGFVSLTDLQALLEEFHDKNAHIAGEIKSSLDSLTDGPAYHAVASTAQRLTSRAIRGPARISRVTPDAMPGNEYVTSSTPVFMNNGRIMIWGLQLDRRFVYSFAYCLLDRETRNESVIRDRLLQFANTMETAIVRDLVRAGYKAVSGKSDLNNGHREMDDVAMFELETGIGPAHIYAGFQVS